MKKQRGILPVFIALIVVSVLGVGAGSYEGAMYYQSNKLVREGDRLLKDGQYREALISFENAGKKFKFSKKKIEPKIAEVQKLKMQDDSFRAGQISFGKGEWQKCLDNLSKVTPGYRGFAVSQEKYSECQSKLASEQAIAAASVSAQAAESSKVATSPGVAKSSSSGSSKKSTTSSSSSSSSAVSSSAAASSSSGSSASSQTPARPVLSLPYSTSVPMYHLSPMGETLYHPKPQNPTGHPGIDFIWDSAGTIEIIASMAATVTGIRADSSHAGAWDVATSNGSYGVDYTEIGSVKSGLAVGSSLNVGDVIGTPQHPVEMTDDPNYTMFHWQFGNVSEDPSANAFVTTRICPLTYFTSGALSTLNSIWASMNWPEIKANAPSICSGDYAG